MVRAVSGSREALEQSLEMAVAHHRAGDFAGAERLYREILSANPRHGETLHLLGLLMMAAGNVHEAEALVRRAVAAAPREGEYLNTLGVLRQAAGDLREAEERFRTAIKRRPGYAEAMWNLAGALTGQDRPGEAVEWARRAVAIQPRSAAAQKALGSALGRHGLPGPAVEAFRAVVAITPHDWAAWSQLLFLIHYLPEVAADELFALHVQVGRGLSEGLGAPGALANDRNPERRLRVGYLSPHLRMNSVSYFALPIFGAHDRRAVEVFCYADVASPDVATQRAEALVDAWRPIHGMSDEAVASAVREDRIDILVDLAGHTGTRLAVLARRAAPVQATYLGYPDTTGLPAVDYRLTDSRADPPGAADALATEKLVRLDPCAWCYAPLTETPEVAARSSGPVTFGSFNDLNKLNAPTLAAWARILHAVPGSRLLLKTFALSEASARNRLAAELRAHGIDAARLSLHGFLPDRAHHELYGEIDLALDPFLYSGTTTTCQALWMGVPVVTLAGSTHAGRVGASLLHAVGLDELIAKDRETYVDTAVALANDRPRLAALRAGLRERMRSSPLMDAPAFCRRLEAAYREMWHAWCSGARL